MTFCSAAEFTLRFRIALPCNYVLPRCDILSCGRCGFRFDLNTTVHILIGVLTVVRLYLNTTVHILIGVLTVVRSVTSFVAHSFTALLN